MYHYKLLDICIYFCLRFFAELEAKPGHESPSAHDPREKGRRRCEEEGKKEPSSDEIHDGKRGIIRHPRINAMEGDTFLLVLFKFVWNLNRFMSLSRLLCTFL